MEQALPALGQLCMEAQQSGGDAAFTLQQISAAEEEILAWVERANAVHGVTPGVWWAVGEANLPGLLTLYALALRRSSASLESSVSEPLRQAYSQLRALLSDQLRSFIDAVECRPRRVTKRLACSTLLAVLRCHGLRCHAALLAEAAEQLAPEPSQGGSGARPRRPSQCSMEAAGRALYEARWLLCLVLFVLPEEEDEHGPPSDATTLLSALASELEASCFLDHWARLVLLVAQHGGCEDTVASELHCLSCVLAGLQISFDAEGIAWRRAVLLVSPCLSYLLSSHVAQLCAALDGGETYGMPAATAATAAAATAAAEEDGGDATSTTTAGSGAPGVETALLFTAEGRALQQRWEVGGVGAVLAQWALGAWREVLSLERRDAVERLPEVPPPGTPLRELYRRLAGQDGPQGAPPGADAQLPTAQQRLALSATPPLNSTAVFELSMRLVAAAQAGFAAVASGGGGATQYVAVNGVAELVRQALLCGREAMGGEAVMAADALDPDVLARLVRWWAAHEAAQEAGDEVVAGWRWYGRGGAVLGLRPTRVWSSFRARRRHLTNQHRCADA